MTNDFTTLNITSEDLNNDKKIRLDKFLTDKYPDLTRSKIKKMILDKLVFINNKETTVHQFLREGDLIKILPIDYRVVKKEAAKKLVLTPKESKLKKTRLFNQIKIIADEKDFLVIEKPAGLLVHPTKKEETTTLVDWLVEKYPDLKKIGDDPQRAAIVHRLDKDVSGLMIVPKTQDSFDYFKKLFKLRTIVKKYTALVSGEISRDEDEITFPIGRSKGKKGIFAARPHSQETEFISKKAHTKFFVLKRFINYTLLEIQILTGRTHQIRVHMLAYGHPVVGDTLYAKRIKAAKKTDLELNRLFLHASYLSFEDQEGKKFEFSSKLPAPLETFLELQK